VEAHGGSVVAESVPGQWTAFRFTFPTAMAIAKNDKEQPNHA
jgi:signal transduction histidine kinase